MSPRLEREAAMDDTAAWAETNRFAAIACGIPEARQPLRGPVPQHVLVARVPLAHTNVTTLEDRALSKHLDAIDGSEALADLSFQALLDLYDECSENGDWNTGEDVATELNSRRLDANIALRRLFATACDNGGTVPMIVGTKLAQVDVAEVVRETMSTNWGTELGSELVLHVQSRASVIDRMAKQFVDDSAEDLLRAGWTE